MPKVTLSPEIEDRERLRENLERIKRLSKYDNKQLSKIIGKGEQAFARRLKNPGRLEYDEAVKLCKACKIDIKALIFGVLELNDLNQNS